MITSQLGHFIGHGERKYPQPGSGRWQLIEGLVMETVKQEAAWAVGVQRVGQARNPGF
jgi:hypothetical protein